jgi:plasmid stability protein
MSLRPYAVALARTRRLGATIALDPAMPSVQIENLPADVHRTLRRRAAEAGQSLQEYVRARLIEEARRPTLDEMLRRAGERTGGEVSLADAARSVRSDRDAR